MKSLTPQQVEALVCLVAETREQEFDCSQCQHHVSEFAEKQLAGMPLSEALACVEHHLTVCPECREEFRALEEVLRAQK